MRNVPNAANTPGATGGEYEHLIGQAGRLRAGDTAEDLKKLQDALKQLGSEKRSLLEKLLSDYKEQRSQGVSQEQALSELEGKLRLEFEGSGHAVEGEDLNKLVGAMEGGGSGAAALVFYIVSAIAELDNSGGKWDNHGDLSNAGIEELIMYLMMAVSRDARADLKAMAEELKKQNKQKARVRRTAAVAAGAGLILLVGFIFGPRLVPPVDPDSDPPEQNANLPAVQVPVSDAAAPFGAAPGCKISLMSPASAVDLPISGPVNVQWTSDPPGISYALEVQPPEGEPWVIPTDGTSKNIFMENFPAGGAYEITVSTLDAYGAVLCSEVIHFEKPAYNEATAKKEGGDGAYCDPNGMIGC